MVFGLDLNLKNLNHFTGICKRLKVTVWGPPAWSRHANTTLNHDNVSIYCALLTPQWKQSVRPSSVQVGETCSLKCRIAWPDKQNKKFAPILIITEAKNAHFFVQRNWVCSSGTQRFCKNDSSSGTQRFCKKWLESSHWLESRYYCFLERLLNITEKVKIFFLLTLKKRVWNDCRSPKKFKPTF